MVTRCIVGLVCVAAIAACGDSSGEDVADYAEAVVRMVASMNATIDALYEEQEVTTIEMERARLDGAIDARDSFLAGMRATTPPEEFADIHARGIAVVADLRSATAQLAEAARSSSTLDEWQAMWQGPGGEAFRQADERAIALCREAESAIGARVTTAVDFTSPWLPSSTGSLVDIRLGCSTEERR